MGQSPVVALHATILAPALGALLIMWLPQGRRRAIRLVAAAAALTTVATSAFLAWAYDPAASGYQFTSRLPLVARLGIAYAIGLDGMSLVLVVLTALIITGGVFASWTLTHREQEFFVLLLLLTTGVFGVFASLDLFVFFLFYELAVLPMYLLIGIWGTGRKEYAAMKLTLYLLFGSAFILVGILVLYFAAGAGSFYLPDIQAAAFPAGVQRWIFPALYLGFGILAGIWPLHTWSPDGHAAAPTAVSMLHAGVLMKLGAYGVVRIAMPVLPDGALLWAPLMGTIAVVNIVYGALAAAGQRDLKYVIAYSSVSHMGIVLLGAATLTPIGLSGSVFQMFAHGIMTGLFFALVGLVYEKAHTRDIDAMGGFAARMPVVATCFVIGGLSSLGLPGLAGFVAEFLAFLGAWRSAHPWWLVPALLGTLITAVYVLRAVRRIFFGPFDSARYVDLGEARGPERVAPLLLASILVVTGLLPGLVTAPINDALRPILDRLAAAGAATAARVSYGPAAESRPGQSGHEASASSGHRLALRRTVPTGGVPGQMSTDRGSSGQEGLPGVARRAPAGPPIDASSVTATGAEQPR